MATAKTKVKKAVAPVGSKENPAKKPASALAAIAKQNAVLKTAKPNKPLKIGTRVMFTRRNGQEATGVVSGVPEVGANTSAFVPVNTGDKKNPVITKLRQSQLTVIA